MSDDSEFEVMSADPARLYVEQIRAAQRAFAACMLLVAKAWQSQADGGTARIDRRELTAAYTALLRAGALVPGGIEALPGFFGEMLAAAVAAAGIAPQEGVAGNA